MNFITLVNYIKNLQTVDKVIITNLYLLSEKSLKTVIALSSLIALALYPIFSYSIVLWSIALVSLSVFRLRESFEFKNNYQKHTLAVWYKRFVISAFMTAVLFTVLGCVYIHYVDAYYQLFIVTVLVGLASGATTSLSADIRVAIVYNGLIIVPLLVTILILDIPLHYVLAILIIIYFITQVMTLLTSYTQEIRIKELEEEKTLLHNLFKEAPLGIFSYDKDLNIIDCNKQLNSLFDSDRETIIGLNLNHLPDRRPISTMKNALIYGQQSYVGPYTSIGGKDYWIESKAFPFTNKVNNSIEGIGLIEDKTKEHNALEELEYLTQHDVLTGLLNRRGFKNNMEKLINSSSHKELFSLLFYMDLNQFKGINDSLGHTVGDEVLLSVSERLIYSLGHECNISRIGGDEFIIVVPYVSHQEDIALTKADMFSEKIQNIFIDPFIIESLHLHVKSSIGIILIEPNYTNIEEIIRHADITMYQAKKANSNISYYNEDLDRKQKELFDLQHDLAYAIEKNQLDMFFQPIVTIKEDKLFSAEALIRWEHPVKGLLSPIDFIPLAIKAGMLSQITWWVLDTVCNHIVQWKKENIWQLEYISINVNAQQLVEKDFARKFLKKLKENGLDTSDIMIEITERSLIDSFDTTQDIINMLRKEGVKCAVDDFGIGYSSLSYLKRLSFNTLKIDRAFVQDIESNPKELLLVSTILDIGRQFNYRIVIEGIEDQKQKELLLGLDGELLYQGFYFSKPLHAETFSKKFLKEV
ncbi:MAG: hypothetical protein DRG09_00795 [Epsilonproteobacteria bacterium]|nr:MAG: hypothetical protein DRG09_00795 [Campylobacterota bacterium]